MRSMTMRAVKHLSLIHISLAAAVGAHKLVILTDVDGLYADWPDKNSCLLYTSRPAGRRGPDQDRSSTVSVTFAQGFSAAGVAAGISSVEGKKDLALVVNNGPLDAAAVSYTHLAVVIMRLVRLTVRLLTIRLALHARVPARICARPGLLAALSVRPAARLLIAGPRRLLTIRLASLLRLCRATVVASGCGGILLSIRLGSAINIRVVIRPVLARHSTCRLYTSRRWKAGHQARCVHTAWRA